MRVILTDYCETTNRILIVKAARDRLGVSLATARDAVSPLWTGSAAIIEVGDEETAKAFLADVEVFGVRGHVLDGEGLSKARVSLPQDQDIRPIEIPRDGGVADAVDRIRRMEAESADLVVAALNALLLGPWEPSEGSYWSMDGGEQIVERRNRVGMWGSTVAQVIEREVVDKGVRFIEHEWRIYVGERRHMGACASIEEGQASVDAKLRELGFFWKG